MIPLLMDFWLAGWAGPLVGDVAKDIYGNAITVGSVVKFVGVVTAINLNDTHFKDIQIMPSHPGANLFIPDTSGELESPNFPPSNIQRAAGPYGFHPSQLVVGA